MIRAERGPLTGISVLELGGVGPVPFCGVTLADLGAEVIRVERPSMDTALSRTRGALNLHARGKRSIALDLRLPGGRQVALDLAAKSDIVIEGFRPGVVERLGLGPSDCLAVNPRLVFGRMSGWGKRGELSNHAGHDINYASVAGLLGTIGTAEQPVPPLNIVGDFGGALYLVIGLLAARLHAQTTGRGQIVDASIYGGTVGLMSQLFAIKDHGEWRMQRQTNWLDGGAPFYRAYRTADDRFMAVGAIEPQFYAALLKLLKVEQQVEVSSQLNRDTWTDTIAIFAKAFATRSREEWTTLAMKSDACVTPVLNLDEARQHPHALSAGVFTEIEDRIEPAPQPQFSATPTVTQSASHFPGADSLSILKEMGRDAAGINELIDAGVVAL
jgi:alpha-methylacyl-CoA racemase